MFVLKVCIILDIFLLLYQILDECIAEEYNDANRLNVFYFGETEINNGFNGVKDVDWEKVYWIVWFYIAVGSICATMANENRTPYYWNGTGVYMNELPVVMLTVLVTLVTFLGVIAKWDNKNYLAFTIRDIISRYKVARKIKYMLVLTVFSWIFHIFCPVIYNIWGYDIYFGFKSLILLFFMSFMARFSYLVYIFIEILFGHSLEQRILQDLGMKYNFHNKPHMSKKWKKEHFVENVEFLLDKFVEYFNKIRWEQIVKVEFDTNLDENSRRFQVLKKKSILNIGLKVIKCILLLEISVNRNITGYDILLCMFLLIAMILYKFGANVAMIMIIPIYGRKGYWIIKKSRKEIHKFTTESISWRKCRYTYCIKYLKSIIVFCSIAMENQKFKQDFEDLICSKYSNNVVVWLVMDYCYYRKEKKHLEKFLEKFFKEFSVDKNLNIYKQLVKSVILDMDKSYRNGKLDDSAYETYIKSFCVTEK